jgi:hypothetical protein
MNGDNRPKLVASSTSRTCALTPLGAAEPAEAFASTYYQHVLLPQLYDGAVFIAESTAAKPLK